MSGYWELNGGVGDTHRILVDDQGEVWGWENLTPRDPWGAKAALLSGAKQWHHYTVTVLPRYNESGT